MSESQSEGRPNFKYGEQNFQKQKDSQFKKDFLQEEKATYRKDATKNIFINFDENGIHSDKIQQCQAKSIENQDRTKDNILGSPHSPFIFSIERDILNLSNSQQANKDSQFQLFDRRDILNRDNDLQKNDRLSKNFSEIKHNLLLSKIQSDMKTQSERFEMSQYGILDSSNLQAQPKKFQIKKGIEFLVIKNVKKFMSNIKKKSRSLLFKALSKPQFSLINDISSNYDYYLESGYFNLSESFFKLAWDVFMVLFNILFIAYVPLYHVFLDLFPEKFEYQAMFIKISMAIFLLEILVNLNSGIFKNGLVIKDRAEILKKQYKNLMQKISILKYKNTIKFYFIRKDMFILMSLMLSIKSRDENPFSFFNYLAFLKISDVSSKLEELESKFRFNETMSNIFKLSHIICCIFLKIGLEQDTGQSWIIFYNLQNSGFSEQYLNSLYYCLITMTTIGYGDITPKTLTEKSFILLVSVAACAVFGYTFSQISEIVKDLEKKKKDFNRNMQIINREMNNKGISITLQHKVRKYFEYQKKIEEKKSFMQTDMIETLPIILKQEVLLDVNKQILEKHYIFSKLSQECMQEISLIFHQKKYFPGEVIFNEGEREENLYFIWSGEVNITKQYQSDNSTSSETTLRILKKKDFFGQVGFFIDNPNPYTAKAKSFLNLSYITRNDFFSCLQKYPQDYVKLSFFKIMLQHINLQKKERICYIRDNISLYKQISFLETKCFSCGDYNHYLQQCPSVHLVASINQREYKPNYSSQDQFPPTTRRLKKYNVLIQLERFYLDIIDFWNLKVNDGQEEESILDNINDIIENKQNNSVIINSINNISENSDEDSLEKLQLSKSMKQRLTINTFSSKDKKKQSSQLNYMNNSYFSSNRNINNIQNNFQNQFNIKEEYFDITSEQSIQNIQELPLKKNDNLNLDHNNNDSPIDVQITNLGNIGVSRTSSINVKKLYKSDLTSLPEADDNNYTILQPDHQEKNLQKDDPFLPPLSYTQNIIQENPQINKFTNKDEDSNNTKTEQLDQQSKNKKNPSKLSNNNDSIFSIKQINNQIDYHKEEDIDNSQTFPSLSKIHRKNIQTNNVFADIRAHRAQFMDLKQEDSQYKISPLQEEVFSNHCISSPLRKNILRKNPVRKQPSIELDIFSPEVKNRDAQRKLTKHKIAQNKQLVMIDSNQNLHQNSNLNFYQPQMEEMQSQRKITIKQQGSCLKLKELQNGLSQLDTQNEQIILQNTQNLINYIKFMQDNKLISPILENKVNSMVEFNKKKKTYIIQNGVLAFSNDNEMISPNQKEEKMQSSRNIPNNNRKKLSITGSINKKGDKQTLDKGKTVLCGERNQFFPVSEDIVKRNTQHMDLNLLIYRKQLVWNSDIQKQLYGIIDFDEEDDIDALKQFDIYFPQGNLDKVLEKYNKKSILQNKKCIPMKTNKRHDSKANVYKIRENRLSKMVMHQPTFQARQSILKKF